MPKSAAQTYLVEAIVNTVPEVLINRQDWHMCELSQKGVSSRAYQPSPYSPREALPTAFDRHYLEQMRD